MTPDTRTPGAKLFLTLLVAALLAVPLFAIYLLVWDRQTQSQTASASITQGWGGPQRLAGPLLAIPFQADSIETVTENGRVAQRSVTVARELVIAPDRLDATTAVAPERRRRSIYRAVVYTADTAGEARFSIPADLARLGVPAERLQLDRAELRFGLSDPRGLAGAPPRVTVAGRPLALQPGHGAGRTGEGFFAPVDAGALRTGALAAAFRFTFRGNASLALAPDAGDTRWRVTSAWPNPSFTGGFLPVRREIATRGFAAEWRVGNLALGQGLAAVQEPGAAAPTAAPTAAPGDDAHLAQIDLVTPVDIYAEVNRSVKYGFLFIGFTFATFLLWDVIGGVRVAVPEYLLVGVGLILFFVLLLALAEVIGFTAAYLLASAAIIGLLAAYSAAVLGGWRRGGVVAGLLAALYAVLYVLLSLEDFSLLIGALLLFAALAGVMYVTRRLDWGVARAG